MTKLRVGVAGLGTVGSGLVKLLLSQKSVIEERCGGPVLVTAVSAKDRSRNRDFDIGKTVWHDDAVSLAKDENVDVVCELIGGVEGIALKVCEAAIGSGKHVVTANKAMLAVHGTRLAKSAEKHGWPRMS